MKAWHPTVDDLSPWTRRAMNEAYDARERKQMSREDFQAGFLAALVALGSKSSFIAGRWDQKDEIS
jgi:hypothetical protein